MIATSNYKVLSNSKKEEMGHILYAIANSISETYQPIDNWEQEESNFIEVNAAISTTTLQKKSVELLPLIPLSKQPSTDLHEFFQQFRESPGTKEEFVEDYDWVVHTLSSGIMPSSLSQNFREEFINDPLLDEDEKENRTIDMEFLTEDFSNALQNEENKEEQEELSPKKKQKTKK